MKKSTTQWKDGLWIGTEFSKEEVQMAKELFLLRLHGNAKQNYFEVPSDPSQNDYHQENKWCQMLVRVCKRMKCHHCRWEGTLMQPLWKSQKKILKELNIEHLWQQLSHSWSNKQRLPCYCWDMAHPRSLLLFNSWQIDSTHVVIHWCINDKSIVHIHNRILSGWKASKQTKNLRTRWGDQSIERQMPPVTPYIHIYLDLWVHLICTG